MRSGKGFRRLAVATLALGAAAGLSTTAQAVAVNCPGTEATLFDPGSWGNALDREFTVATASAATCTATGSGTFSDSAATSAGYTKITSGVSVGGVGNDHGSFSLSSALWSTYTSVLFVLQGDTSAWGLWSNPDWAAFSLASGTTGGSWAVSSDKLIRGTFYGSTAAASVPEPATLALFGAGLAALGFARRRRVKI